MTVRIGINGFGRMGRLALRAGCGREDLVFVRVNETATDATGSAYLLKFDSVHGTWVEACKAGGDVMTISGQDIRYSRNPTIDETDWSDCDIVIEATGKHHKQPQTLQGYFDQGVKKVIVAALSTMVIDDTQVKIYAWYDNEWGYVNRMMDLASKVAGSL